MRIVLFFSQKCLSTQFNKGHSCQCHQKQNTQNNLGDDKYFALQYTNYTKRIKKTITDKTKTQLVRRTINKTNPNLWLQLQSL